MAARVHKTAPALVRCDASVDIAAAAPAPSTPALAGSDAPAPKARAFTMAGYTGAEMNIWGERLIMDLAGMKGPKGAFPALRQHSAHRIAGHAESCDIDPEKGVTIKGRLSSITADGREVAALSDEGFPWQASMGWQVAEYEEVEEGDEQKVNGRAFAGPGLIARKSVICEASFVPLGADNATSAVAASEGDPRIEVTKTNRRTPMADPTPAPKGATFAELKAAFPKAIEFACEQFEKAATLEAAKAAYADILQAKLDAAEAQAAKSAPAAPKGPSQRAPVPVSGAAPAAVSANASARYRERIDALQAKGKSALEARRTISVEDPELQAAFVSEVNASREWQQFPRTEGGPRK